MFGNKTPVLHQAEMSECGLACAAMVAHTYGNRVDLPTLRRRHPISLAGLNLRSLLQLLGDLGINGTAVRVEMEYLKSMRTPCILHWGFNHFIVLVRANGRRITIHDPAIGRMQLTYDEASEHVTGVGVLCSPGTNIPRSMPRPPLRVRDLWQASNGFGLAVVALFVLICLGELSTVATPYITQMVVDRAIPSSDFSSLVALCVALGGMAAISATCGLMRNVFANQMSSHVAVDIERNVFQHMVSLPSRYFEQRSVGDIMNRLESVTPVQHFISNDATLLLVDSILASATLFIMLLYNPLLTVIPVITVLVVLAVRLGSTKVMGSRVSDSLKADARERSVLLETIRCQRAIKIFGREVERIAIWQSAMIDHVRSAISLSNFGFVVGTVTQLVVGAEAAALLLIGGKQVIAGDLTLGMFVAFIAYATMFSGRSLSLADQIQQFRLLKFHKDRVADIVQSPTERVSRNILGIQPRIESIELREATFSYARYQPPVLKNITLTVGAGDFLILEGHSGSGKTTLLKLLTATSQPTEGTLWINGSRLEAFGVASFRDGIGVVMQDDTLLSGSIVDNVCFFDAEPDIAAVEEACKLSQIHDDIMRMPMGYRSFIGELGSALSGGQRQRLLIARALYRNPDVLFLDEGTANLDQEREFQILVNLKERGKTVVLITHGAVGSSLASRHVEVRDGDTYER